MAGIALATVLTLYGQPAAGQACLGAPLPVPGFSLLGGLGFAAHDFEGDVTGAEYGLEGRIRLPLGVAGSVGVWRRNLEGTADPTVLKAEASWTIPALPFPTFGLRICPLVGLTGSFVSEEEAGHDFKTVTAPVGLSVGWPLTVGDELGVAPYMAFRWLFSRVNGDVLRVHVDETDDAASLELGVGARLGRLLGIASVSFAGLDPDLGPAPHPDRLLSLRVGYVF